jgi:hypothetical protein
MKNIIKILAMAAILGLAYNNAFAIGMKSTSDLKKSIDQTVAQLEKAVAAFDKGGNQKMVIELLMEAKQAQKSISSANGNLSMIKSKASQKLREARSSFEQGDLSAGGAAMKEALAGFKELREKYHAMH